MNKASFNARQQFTTGSGQQADFFSLPALEKAGVAKISRLPVSIRIVLESVLRNCDGQKILEKDVQEARQLEADRRADRGNSVHRRADCAAGFHRRAAAGGSGGDAFGRRARWARTGR